MLLLLTILFTASQGFATQFEDVSQYASFPDHFLCDQSKMVAQNNIRMNCSSYFPTRYPVIFNEYVLYARQVGPRLFECRYRMIYDCALPQAEE